MENENVEQTNNQEVKQKDTIITKIGMGAIAGLLIVIITLFFTFTEWWSGLIWGILLIGLWGWLLTKVETSMPDKKEIATPISSIVVFVISLLILLYSMTNTTTSSSSSSETSTPTYNQSSYSCPHCGGSGQRTNSLNGIYGNCSSCEGTGKVSSERYKRLSK